MTHLKQAAYDAGVEHALASLGLEKTALVPLAAAGLMTAGRAAVMQAGRAALPYLARAGTSLMGMGRGALAAGKGVATAARGAAAAGQGMSGAARAGWGAFQTAAPAVSKGLQRAGNVLSHPLTDVGMSGAALWKNASTRAEALAMTDPAALKQLLARSGRALRPENPSLPHVRMLMNDVSAGEISPAMQALSAQAGRPVVADALAYARQHAPADVPDLRGDWLAGIRDMEGVGPRGKLPG